MALGGLWTGELTVRRACVLLRHLPPEAAVWAALGQARSATGWSIAAYLLTDIYSALTGEKHPARPDAAANSRARDVRDRLRAQRERLAKRKRPA